MFLSAREQNVPVNGIILKEKAVFFAKELNIEDFQASNGWLEQWKTRNNISFKTVAGEAKSCHYRRKEIVSGGRGGRGITKKIFFEWHYFQRLQRQFPEKWGGGHMRPGSYGTACTPVMTASWNERLLPTILSKYKLEDIYNADEFGLFRQDPSSQI